MELLATAGIIRAVAIVTGAAAALWGPGPISPPATIMTDSTFRRMHVLPMASDTNHRPDRHRCNAVFATSRHHMRRSGENVLLPPRAAVAAAADAENQGLMQAILLHRKPKWECPIRLQ